jgi:hypothetical protein
MIKKITALIPCLFYFLTVSFGQHHPANAGTKTSYGSVGYADSINSGLIPRDTLKGSVHRTTMLTIGGCHIHIEYSSPGVRGRVIWGGLVPYDEVWVTGSHNATTISLSKPIKIGGSNVPAGTYAIFTIPGKKEWYFIINKNASQHLADDYKQAEDLLRIKVQPKANAMTQRLTYSVVESKPKAGILIISWELFSMAIPFETL